MQQASTHYKKVPYKVGKTKPIIQPVEDNARGVG